MTIAASLKILAKLCSTAASKCLERKLAMGPKPDDPIEALVWDQERTRLSGQIDSLSAMNVHLGSASIAAALKDFSDELNFIAGVSKDANSEIRKIKQVSQLLTKVARVLDLGLAVIAAAANPGAAAIGAALKAANAVSEASE
ncbi:MAG: hypothetical protein AAF941_00975 [Pseudomonadota bacterium]